MRKINKGISPGDFEAWKAQNPNKTFRNLTGLVKQNLKRSLLTEQLGLCGYCCDQISMNSSHVEHIIPHSSQIGQLDYNNLICSCNGYIINRNTCGHKKDNDKIPISPLDNDCESRFIYSISGQIQPSKATDSDASETIRILNLNSYELETARKTAIKMLMHDDDISENKDFYIRKYSTPINGMLESFAPMKLYIIEKYI